MRVPIQTVMKNIGESGCYFLCLVRFANQDFSKVVKLYNEAVQNDWMDEDCYVKDPVAILNHMGCNFTKVEKTEDSGQIAMYKHGAHNHFVCIERGKVWDPLGYSNTVKNGHIVSYRRFS